MEPWLGTIGFDLVGLMAERDGQHAFVAETSAGLSDGAPDGRAGDDNVVVRGSVELWGDDDGDTRDDSRHTFCSFASHCGRRLLPLQSSQRSAKPVS